MKKGKKVQYVNVNISYEYKGLSYFDSVRFSKKSNGSFFTPNFNPSGVSEFYASFDSQERKILKRKYENLGCNNVIII